MKTVKMGIVLKREDKEKSETVWEKKALGNAKPKKKKCSEGESNLCGNLFSDLFELLCFSQNTFSPQNSKSAAAGGFGEWEDKWEEHKQKHWRDERKILRELQTKVKQGKIQRMKKAKAKGKHVAGSRRGALSNLWLSGSVSLWEPVCLSLETGRHQRGRCFL